MLLDPRERICVETVDPLRTPEDAVELDQQLVLGAVRQAAQ
jgi:hypothetical protein